MNISEINYSESRKLTTGKRFESKLISFSAKMALEPTDHVQNAAEELKKWVRAALDKAVKEAE